MTQIRLVTAQISQSPAESTPVPPPPSTPFASVMSSIYLLGFLTTYGALLWEAVRRRKDEPTEISLPVGSHMPCRSCQFFSNNGYLKCAVNPSIALTKSAIDCSDYCPTQKALKKMQKTGFYRRE
ncbi:MAG: hypothetical protein MUC48_11450 [Leptolyngbya sp. Prado105]|jgi:hypothetical protein|nr:hypothetical protein [Leptolyngbya sp. Prado105]